MTWIDVIALANQNRGGARPLTLSVAPYKVVKLCIVTHVIVYTAKCTVWKSVWTCTPYVEECLDMSGHVRKMSR
jgi:hypothetical protein